MSAEADVENLQLVTGSNFEASSILAGSNGCPLHVDDDQGRDRTNVCPALTMANDSYDKNLFFEDEINYVENKINYVVDLKDFVVEMGERVAEGKSGEAKSLCGATSLPFDVSPTSRGASASMSPCGATCLTLDVSTSTSWIALTSTSSTAAGNTLHGTAIHKRQLGNDKPTWCRSTLGRRLPPHWWMVQLLGRHMYWRGTNWAA